MIVIKKEYLNTVIAFGSNGAVLSKRTQKELVDLGIIARESGDKSILRFFENLPSIDELRNMKMEEKIQEFEKKRSESTKALKVKRKTNNA